MQDMNVANKEIIEILKNTNALKYGEFTLASGETSNFYIDLRIIPNFPEAFTKLIKHAIDYIKKNIECDAVVAIPLAGIPFGIMIATQLQKPFYLLRKEAKDHGLKKMVEGELKPGQKILLIDDLISSGFSKLFAIDALRKEGAIVKDLFVFVNRSSKDLRDFEREHKIRVHSLINVSDILTKGK